MKKITVVLLALIVLLASCAGKETFELALITDIGTIDDKSFNQGSWEGLAQYAKEHDITHKYYQPAEKSDDAYLTAIDLAVRGGAKLVVTPGFLFETSVFIAQDRYPNVYFVLIDGVPHSKDYQTFRTGDNTVGVQYAEDQAGFLAGYAAVKDGNRRLGFAGGMAVPPVIRFGYGFVQGAEYAASELGLASGQVTINYHYTGGFEATPEVQTLAASWFNSGIDVIFACGGAVGSSVMAAAEQTGKKVIGVDVDQSIESPTVITSAMKGLQSSVYACVADFYAGEFPGGQTLVFSAENDGVGLPMASSKFQTFSRADYDAIYNKLADGVIPRIENLNSDGSPSVVPVSITRVTEIR
jgi:basic membrane protein A